MRDKPCFFCEIDSRDYIADNEQIYAILDEYPVSPGHTLIIPKQHIPDFLHLSPELGVSMLRLIKEVHDKLSTYVLKDFYESKVSTPKDVTQKKFCKLALQAIDDEISLADFNVGINSGENAGQTVNHLHVHLIPRFAGDDGVKTGGVRHIFPERGNYRHEQRNHRHIWH